MIHGDTGQTNTAFSPRFKRNGFDCKASATASWRTRQVDGLGAIHCAVTDSADAVGRRPGRPVEPGGEGGYNSGLLEAAPAERP